MVIYNRAYDKALSIMGAEKQIK